MIHILRRLPLLLIALLPLPLQALDVLFVGNSFTIFPHGFNAGPITDLKGTGYTGVPAIFKKLSMEGGITNINVSLLGVGSTSLTTHLNNNGQVFDQPWDVVILQDYSTRPTLFAGGNGIAAGNIAAFRSSVQAIRDRILQANPNTKIYLYETWARADLVSYGHYPNLQAMQNELRTAYSQAAIDFSLHDWVPVGDAFMQTLAEGVAYNPNGPVVSGLVKLYANDKYHADPPGSFLSAMVFYNRVLGGDPRTLPTGAGSAAQLLSISQAHATELQRIAWEINQTSPIFRHPVSRAATIGGQASFSVNTSGDVTSFQWRLNGAPIPGATSSSLVIPSATTADFGRYDVVVTRANGDTETSRPASLAFATSSQQRTFFIDFGSADAGYPTASPDSTGRHWNNLHLVTTGSGLSQLRDREGVFHPTANLTVSQPFTRVSTNGLNSAGPYPATAQRDSFFVTGTGDVTGSSLGEIIVRNLFPAAQYRFKIFASRSGTGNRTARYVVADQPPLHLNAIDNTTHTVETAFIPPNSTGSIPLQVLPRNAANVLQEYGFIGVLELTETLTTASAYSHWSALNAVPFAQLDPQNDPDADGLPNLLEYALGLDPMRSDNAAALVASPMEHANNTYLSLLIPMNPDAEDVALTIEVSSDLVTWFSGPAHTTVVADTAESRLVRDNTPLSSSPRRFMRVRATAIE